MRLALERTPYQTWGFTLLRLPDRRLAVGSVVPLAQADLAGLKVGDVIESMNGRDYHMHTLDNVLEFLNMTISLDIVIERQDSEAPSVPLTVSAPSQASSSIIPTSRVPFGTGASENTTSRNGQDVIVLDSDDDQCSPSRSASGTIFAHNEVIDLVSDDDDEVDVDAANKRRKLDSSAASVIVKSEKLLAKKFGEANQGDEVVEVHNPNHSHDKGVDVQQIHNDDHATSSSSSSSSSKGCSGEEEDDMVVVGDKLFAAGDMPHARESCFSYAFVKPTPAEQGMWGGAPADATRTSKNVLYCSMCYCYVCDVKASDCGEWQEHCNATYKEHRWKVEKGNRVSKILKLMQPTDRSKFCAKYKVFLQPSSSSLYANVAQVRASYPPAGSSSSSSSSSSNGSNSMAGMNSGGGGANSLGNMLACITTMLSLDPPHATATATATDTAGAESGRSATSTTSSNSMNTSALDGNFLGATDLLLRAVQRYHNHKPASFSIEEFGQKIARIFLAWLLHPCCTAAVRNIVKADAMRYLGKSMFFLLSMNEAALKKLSSTEGLSMYKMNDSALTNSNGSISSSSDGGGGATAVSSEAEAGVGSEQQQQQIREYQEAVQKQKGLIGMLAKDLVRSTMWASSNYYTTSTSSSGPPPALLWATHCGFESLERAHRYLPLWAQLGSTALCAEAYQQTVDCFRAVVKELRSRNVSARVRSTFETCAGMFGRVFQGYAATRGVELQQMINDAKRELKSKAAVVKIINNHIHL